MKQPTTSSSCVQCFQVPEKSSCSSLQLLLTHYMGLEQPQKACTFIRMIIELPGVDNPVAWDHQQQHQQPGLDFEKEKQQCTNNLNILYTGNIMPTGENAQTSDEIPLMSFHNISLEINFHVWSKTLITREVTGVTSDLSWCPTEHFNQQTCDSETCR